MSFTQSKYSFTLNSGLYIKDPNASDAGRKILSHGADLILELGFEHFTLKKLADAAGITEATVYHYFKNKHRLLQYYAQLYWTWLEQQIKVFTAIELDAERRLFLMVRIIANIPDVAADPGVVNKSALRKLIINEGLKAYYHSRVDEDNGQRLFAPLKQLNRRLAEAIHEVNPAIEQPSALAATIIEMAHALDYYRDHLPSLTDEATKSEGGIETFLKQLLKKAINN